MFGRRKRESKTEENSVKTGKRKKAQAKGNREIANITYIFVALFIVMIGYLMYFIAVDSSSVINNSYNSRQELLAKKVVRGKIYSADRQILAETIVNADKTETRNYPFGALFAHAVGFSTHGKTGIESMENFNLLTSNAFVTERLQNTISEEKNIGDNVITTLDPALQKAAGEAMGVYRGAVVVMDPETGKILAMVSKPDFDPNTVDAEWESVTADTETGALVNRATQGLYPGGSTFKIVTALAYLREHMADYGQYEYHCNGHFEKDGQVINCYHGISHGQVDLKQSFADSCNSSFANISTQLNKKKFQDTCNALLFNQELSLDFSCKQSYVPINANSDLEEVMQTAIGQGKTQITPMHMAMITSAVAKDGVLMKPYLIERIENYNQDVIKEYKPDTYGRLMTAEEAGILQTFMKEVVQSGTGTKLKGLAYEAAGKTGSAEYTTDKSESHAWFTGYGKMGEKSIVVTIVVEGAGSGGEYAVPMAKRIFDQYFSQNGL